MRAAINCGIAASGMLIVQSSPVVARLNSTRFADTFAAASRTSFMMKYSAIFPSAFSRLRLTRVDVSRGRSPSRFAPAMAAVLLAALLAGCASPPDMSRREALAIVAAVRSMERAP
jgi:hypothetical protein